MAHFYTLLSIFAHDPLFLQRSADSAIARELVGDELERALNNHLIVQRGRLEVLYVVPRCENFIRQY